MHSKRYGSDILAPGSRRPRPGQGPVPTVEAEPGLVIEDFEGRFCGAVVAVEPGSVTLPNGALRSSGLPMRRAGGRSRSS